MRSSRSTSVALLAALLATAAPAAAAPAPFPRTGLYGSVLGSGYPYTRTGGSLDTLEIGRASRFTEVALDVNPISPYRPDIVAAMRARNPKLVVLAYVLAEDIWNANDADSLRHIPTLIRHTVRNLNGFLYDKTTGLEYAGTCINIAKKGSGGHFVVAEALANIFRDHIIATGTWNGIFFDLYAHTVGWTQNLSPGRVIDYARAGYASLAELDIAWSAACDTLAAHLRRDGGPAFILVGNGGPSADHAWLNGWMRENFPYQQGGTWASNMHGDVASRGYFRDDLDFFQAPHNWIFTASGSAGQEYTAASTKAVRFGLASAALGEGVHCFGPGEKSVNVAPYQDWWYDEYAVDLATGQSSPALQYTGWLGQPLGPAYNYLWAGTGLDAITNPGFETDVTSGWTFQRFAPASATISRDVTTAATGTASAKIHIATAGTLEWHVYLSSVGQLNVFAGNSYSATFRCKASAPRTIQVLAGNSGGTQQITVGTTWKQYQAVLTPTTSMLASLTFFLGTQAGDVWFDDVHFQAGVSSVWRRDFQNGIVLVNPTELSLAVTLEDTYRRILGLRAPSVNNGALSTTSNVPPRDAIFLIRGSLDRTRPAAVRDLRPGP